MLNQKELIARTRATLSYKYKFDELENILNSFKEVILDAVKNGEDASISGLGKFHARFIKGKKINKTGIEWLKGKEFIVPDRVHLGFSPSDSANRTVGQLIDKVNFNEKIEKKEE